MHPFFATFRIKYVELSVIWLTLSIYIYEKLRIRENKREFARLYEEVNDYGNNNRTQTVKSIPLGAGEKVS